MRSMATCSVRYSKSEICRQKHHREVVKNRNSIPNIIVNTYKAKIVNIPYRTTSALEGQATTSHPFPHQQTHNYMLCPISRIQIHSYIHIYIHIYTLIQIIISVQAKLKVIRRKHIVYSTGLGAYSSSCCKGTDNCAGTMGVDQLPSSRSGCRHLTMLTTTNVLQDILPP